MIINFKIKINDDCWEGVQVYRFQVKIDARVFNVLIQLTFFYIFVIFFFFIITMINIVIIIYSLTHSLFCSLCFSILKPSEAWKVNALINTFNFLLLFQCLQIVRRRRKRDRDWINRCEYFWLQNENVSD